MKRAPQWGVREILQMNWVFDEFFASASLARRLSALLRIDSRPVADAHGHVLDGVVQLVNDESVSIATDGLPFSTCLRCGRVKFAHIRRGAVPCLLDSPSGALVRTKEFFGAGAAASNLVLGSQLCLRELTRETARFLALTPVARSDA